MIWGHGRVPYGPFRTRRIMSQSGFTEHLADLTRVVLSDGGVAAYRHVWRRRWDGPTRDTGYLKYLGPSFGTKYLYFLTRAHHADQLTPVLDEVVHRWFRTNAIEVDLRLGQWGYPSRYQTYVEILTQWGASLEIAADDVEHLIFVQQQATDGGRWDSTWLPGVAMSADQLLNQLSMKLVDQGLGVNAQEPLIALHKLLEAAEQVDGDEADAHAGAPDFP